MSIANVFKENLVQWRASELKEGLRDIGTSSFNGDIVVFFKIDARTLSVGPIGVTVKFFL